MLLSYTLSMPRVNSWNGKWSGEDRPHVVVRAYTGSKGTTKAKRILDNSSYHYSWSDGWGARIDVKEVTPTEAKRLRRISVGFSAYDWMIDTIEKYGKPLASHEITPETVPV